MSTAHGGQPTEEDLTARSQSLVIHEMNAIPAKHEVSVAANVKRTWSAPQISTVRITQTALGGGFYAEVTGLNGCAAYDANASTNICVVPS